MSGLINVIGAAVLLALLLAWSFAGVRRPRDPALARSALQPSASAPSVAHRRDPRLAPRRVVLACAVAAGDRAVPVPLLLRALQFPRGERERTLEQARAALGELYEDGVVDLDPMRVPPGSEPFYLRGPEGRVFGIATIAMSLAEARAELANRRVEEVAAS